MSSATLREMIDRDAEGELLNVRKRIQDLEKCNVNNSDVQAAIDIVIARLRKLEIEIGAKISSAPKGGVLTETQEVALNTLVDDVLESATNLDDGILNMENATAEVAELSDDEASEPSSDEIVEKYFREVKVIPAGKRTEAQNIFYNWQVFKRSNNGLKKLIDKVASI